MTTVRGKRDLNSSVAREPATEASDLSGQRPH